MRITLNLASRPYVELRPLYQRLRVMALLLLLAAVAFWWVLRTQHQKATIAHARAVEIEAAISRTQSERTQAEASMRQPQNAAILAQSQFLNNLFLHKSFSWTAVMMDLEQVLPPGVQVLNIDPAVAKNGSVTIRMRVAGPREKSVALVRNLEHSRRFLAPRIVGETAQNASRNGESNPAFQPVNAIAGVNFDVLAEYNPLRPHEGKPGSKAVKSEDKQASVAGLRHSARRAHKPTAVRSTP